MNYQETIEYLFNSTPVFEKIGAKAYKPGLQTTEALDEHFGHPHHQFKTIHVAGTNGKGSCSHTLAAILQAEGYKVGLYTSPHLVDFRERIRVNGECIPEEYVIDFVEKERNFFEPLHCSFFELTTALAFKYFAEQKVDIAVIEVGLGGRLDCTNIITPILSIITNISLDHTQFLGNTLAAIAGEKAGIIKTGIPVVIGEAEDDVREVFSQKAAEAHSPIVFAAECPQIIFWERIDDRLILQTRSFGNVTDELSGDCQLKNANTVLNAIPILRKAGLHIPDDAVSSGFENVCAISGLMGRWTTLHNAPKVVCDTGHNIGGFQYIASQLYNAECSALRIVLGFVSDKDVSHILEIMPTDAEYYFTQASVPRAMDCHTLASMAATKGILGRCYGSVEEAYLAALKESATTDFIYVGGSTFVVADLLSFLKRRDNAAL